MKNSMNCRHLICTVGWVLIALVTWVVAHSLSCVRLFAAPWTAAYQTSLSFTTYWNLLKLMSTESVLPSNCLILCYPLFSCPQSFPATRSFPVSWLFASGGQSIGASASASVPLMNIHMREYHQTKRQLWLYHWCNYFPSCHCWGNAWPSWISKYILNKCDLFLPLPLAPKPCSLGKII